MTATPAGRLGATLLSVAAAVGLVLAAGSGAGTVSAEVNVSPRQGQGGKEIRVVAFVVAHEPLTATGRGKIRVGGENRRLFPKGGSQELSPDEGYALKFRPTAEVARLIARALNRGRKPVARLTVTLRNESGVAQTTHHRAKLTR